MDRNDELSDSGDEEPKRKYYLMSFNKEWLKDPDLKPWIGQDRDMNTVCTVCDCKFKDPNKSALKKHGATSKHTKALADKAATVNIDQFFKKKSTESDLTEKVARAETLLAGYVAEHRVPFRQMDHLSDLLASMFPDSKIASTMKMKRTKASYVVQHGIAHDQKQYVSTICRENWFSLIIDESTDISVSQVLAIVVRYHHQGKVCDSWPYSRSKTAARKLFTAL